MSSENDVKKAIAGTIANDGKPNPWPARLESFKKFSEKFHDQSGKIEQRYEDNRDNEQAPGVKKVNMFYSNVTIIKESLYNSLPKPTAERSHKSEFDNDVARVAATIVERGLSYEVSNAPNFDQAIKSAIVDRLVPGLGTVWINFNGVDGDVLEHLTVDVVYWKDFLYEPQRNWELVTWAGRKLHVTPEVARQRWGEAAVPTDNSGKAIDSPESAMTAGKVCIIQMWDKATKTVIHMTESGQILKTDADPYKLKKFFPCPRPLIACPPTRKFLPMPDYYMAQDQYMQLDTLYTRIGLIIEAVRVAGVYDASNPEVSKVLAKEAENKMIPVDNWAMFSEKGGMKGSVDWYPVETIATVLTHLINTFSFVKNQLFEVTGMADIIRGSSNQYETLGAQQIKAQFASVRMNGFQRDVAHFVRDVIRIMAELQVQLYSRETLSKVVGILPEADQQHVDPALQMLQDDHLFGFNVDIEPDSMTQADWSLQQEQRMAYGQALSQFLAAALPVSQQTPELGPLLVQIIKFMSVGFKGSSELEGTLDQIMDNMGKAEPKEPPKDPAVVKAEVEAQVIQQKAELDGTIRQQEGAAKIQFLQQEAELKKQEREAELEFQNLKNIQQLQHEEKMFELKMRHETVLAGIKAEQVNNDHEADRQRKDKELEAGIERDTKSTIAGIERDGIVSTAKTEIMKSEAAAKPKPKPTRRR